MKSSPALSIILPCYNPVSDWMSIVEKNLHLMEAQVSEPELIVINDGSTKNFDEAEFKKKFAGHKNVLLISHPENKGKGAAVRSGVKQSKGELVIYTDIDFPYTNDSFVKVMKSLKSGQSDLVSGKRLADYYSHMADTRVRVSKLLKFLIRKLLHLPIDDTQCGLKGFNQVGKELFLQTTVERYLFDLEFIFLAARKKLRIATVDVELRPEVRIPAMSWRILVQESGSFLKILMTSIF